MMCQYQCFLFMFFPLTAFRYISNSEAFHIALGNIDLYTKEKVANFNPDTDMVCISYIFY